MSWSVRLVSQRSSSCCWSWGSWTTRKDPRIVRLRVFRTFRLPVIERRSSWIERSSVQIIFRLSWVVRMSWIERTSVFWSLRKGWVVRMAWVVWLPVCWSFWSRWFIWLPWIEWLAVRWSFWLVRVVWVSWVVWWQDVIWTDWSGWIELTRSLV